MHIANSIIVLKPGIHILRHPKQGLPPLSIGRAPSTRRISGRIEILSTSRTHGSILRDGSDCIVMHVIDADVELIVSATMVDATTQIPKLKIDTVALDPDPMLQIQNTPAMPTNVIKVPDKGLSIIGHIEQKGDVVVTGGQQLGDPGSLLRLEGFQLVWPDKPDGLNMSYSAVLEGASAKPAVAIGNFCGSRNASRRITSLTMTLNGPDAANYCLKGVAYFSGGFHVSLQSGIDASGPSGFEHLVGLQLDILRL